MDEVRPITFSLPCPTCGEEALALNTTTGLVECPCCGLKLTKEDAIGDNAALLRSKAEELASKVIDAEVRKVRESLRRQFANSKYIKFK